jgi:hypothetical protein
MPFIFNDESTGSCICLAYRLYFLTCDMYKSGLRHIHDPVHLSLKMKGIRLPFVAFCILSLFNGIDVGIGHTCKAARLKRDCNNMRLSG